MPKGERFYLMQAKKVNYTVKIYLFKNIKYCSEKRKKNSKKVFFI